MPDQAPRRPRAIAEAIGIGLLAGFAAAAVMEAAQSVLMPLAGEQDGDPATVKAADSISEALTGGPVPEPTREGAGDGVHYALGAALGALYAAGGLAAPGLRSAFGALFGTGTMLLLDDGLVPAAGWGAPPWETPARTHLYSFLSHLVFGAALEGTRRLIATVAAPPGAPGGDPSRGRFPHGREPRE